MKDIELYQIVAGVVLVTFFLSRLVYIRCFGKAAAAKDNTGRSWFYILITVVMISEVLGFTPHFTDPSFGPLMLVGIVLTIIGFSGQTWVRIARGKTWGLMGSGSLGDQHELVTHGPYRVSRHPYYVALTLHLVGFQLICSSWFILLVLIWCVVWIYNARKEEEELRREYGDQWTAYTRQTPFFIGF